jgi:phosphatidate cytidylyltransferase
MLRTRIVVGSLLAGLTLGVLFLDDRLTPWYPFLYLFFAAVGALGCWELLRLIPPAWRPSPFLCHFGVQAIVLANWIRPIHESFPEYVPWSDPWLPIMCVLAALVIVAFLIEMAAFRGSGERLPRIALTPFAVCYLGLLASFLAQLRWLPSSAQATNALMLTIFVPKVGDIGAYCTGRLIGRHRMTPVLSPKKTWEGAAGGIAAAVVTSVGVSLFGTRPEYYVIKAIGLGLALAVAGLFGDLAESLLKRESQKKDASDTVPGFGGVLDVIDSVLFAAPLSFLWLTSARLSPLG